MDDWGGEGDAHACAAGAAVGGVVGVGGAGMGMGAGMGLPALGYGALPGALGLAMHPQSPNVFMKMQTPDLDAGACWYDHDVPPTLGVADIFDDAAKF